MASANAALDELLRRTPELAYHAPLSEAAYAQMFPGLPSEAFALLAAAGPKMGANAPASPGRSRPSPPPVVRQRA